MARSQYTNMPALLRFLLNILGAKSHSGDLLSFLLFEKEFTLELIKLGYEDTLAAKESVLNFFEPWEISKASSLQQTITSKNDIITEELSSLYTFIAHLLDIKL